MNEASAASTSNSQIPANRNGSTAGGPDTRGAGTGESAGTNPSSGHWLTSSSSVQLARSKQTWTGAGSAAGYVLRYLTPMHRLMMDVVGDEQGADRALTILVAHLVKAGFSGHDKGRLRDFLIRGIRSAAKARYDEVRQDREQPESLEIAESSTAAAPRPPQLDAAQVDSPHWLGYWRECILQRSWRSLERFQHASRYERGGCLESAEGKVAREDLVHDALRVAMSEPSGTPESWAGKIATMAGRSVQPDEVKRQVELARIRFAQQIADEVAQTLDAPDPQMIQAEIKTLGLGKAFAGIKVEA